MTTSSRIRLQGVYLIHFEQPYKHASHYIGYSTDVYARLDAHRGGTGARLMEVIAQAGIQWQLAFVWWGAGRAFERRLKAWHGAGKFCPICRMKKLRNENISSLPKSWQQTHAPDGGCAVPNEQE